MVLIEVETEVRVMVSAGMTLINVVVTTVSVFANKEDEGWLVELSVVYDPH